MELLERLARQPWLHYWEQRIVGWGFYAEVKSWLQREGAFEAGRKVLEIGSGQGILARWFQNGCYVGLDTDFESLRFARRRTSRPFICQDALELSFREGVFDRVISVGVVHHLRDRELEIHLREALRVLRPTGRLLVADSLKPDPSDRLRFWFSTLERGAYLRREEELCKTFSEIRPAPDTFRRSKTSLLQIYSAVFEKSGEGPRDQPFTA